jgi:hypothetical protein
MGRGAVASLSHIYPCMQDQTTQEQVRRLQAWAGIRLTEEVTVSSSGYEMEEAKERHGYDDFLDAANHIKQAEALINKLVQDQKIKKQEEKIALQQHLMNLQKISKNLTNLASGGVKKKEKTLTP